MREPHHAIVRLLLTRTSPALSQHAVFWHAVFWHAVFWHAGDGNGRQGRRHPRSAAARRLRRTR
ncbi:hypothetical protein ACU635_09355 [[Actinomadura] parvosata]|uniref:hypothetical protein n=1 Tax=[Actinomadura] parvosata TaxID=1955412 RepID=UPI00406BF5A2